MSKRILAVWALLSAVCWAVAQQPVSQSLILPKPMVEERTGQTVTLAGKRDMVRIVLSGEPTGAVREGIGLLQRRMAKLGFALDEREGDGLRINLVRCGEEVLLRRLKAHGIAGQLEPERIRQAYHLVIGSMRAGEASVRLEAADDWGLFYGLVTLCQLFECDEAGSLVAPSVEILDFPAIARRLAKTSAENRPELVGAFVSWLPLYKISQVGLQYHGHDSKRPEPYFEHNVTATCARLRKAGNLESIVYFCPFRGTGNKKAGPLKDAYDLSTAADRAAYAEYLLWIMSQGAHGIEVDYNDWPGSHDVAIADVLNLAWSTVRGRYPDASVLYCPPASGDEAYRGMATPALQQTLSRVPPGVWPLWTGMKTLITEPLTAEQVTEWTQKAGRRPFLWVNRVSPDVEHTFSRLVPGRAEGRVFQGELLPRDLNRLFEGVHLNAGLGEGYNTLPGTFESRALAYMATAADFLWNPGDWEAAESYRRAVRFVEIMRPLLADAPATQGQASADRASRLPPAACAATRPAPLSLEVAKEGEALVDIVLPDQATPAEGFAAHELHTYIQRISDADISVVSEGTISARPRLLVGRTRAAEAALRELSGEDPDAFTVRANGPDLLLLGASDRSTLYAVYDLLERDLGCRWLAPGDAWEEVPVRSRVVLNPADRTERPGFRYRYERMTLLGEPGTREHDCFTWAVRQRINVGNQWPTPADRDLLARCGGFRAYLWPHSTPHLTDMEKLCREHPTWLALVNGERRIGSSPLHTNFCTTDPEVIAFTARLLSDAFDAQPEVELLPVGPGDGIAFCECERCRALDTGGSWVYSGKAYPALSDRWLTFVNAVAEKLAASHPDKKVYTLAYHQTFTPPVKVRPRSNVMIMVVNSRPEGVCFVHPVTRPDCPGNTLFGRNFVGWQALTPAGMLAYQYIPHSTFCGMPLSAPRKFITDISWLVQQGCVGYEAQSSVRLFGLYGVSLYAIAKALWNPGLDPDVLIRDYCDAAFHESSGPMQRFFAALEEGQAAAEHTSTGVWTALTPDVLARAAVMLAEAQSAAQGENVKCRLAGLSAHFEYAKTACEAYRLAGTAQTAGDPGLLDQAEQLVHRMNDRLEAARKAEPSCCDIQIDSSILEKTLAQARRSIKPSPAGRPQ